jgi:hypothetical protein
MMKATTMVRGSGANRLFLKLRQQTIGQQQAFRRSFHVTSIVAADALDMTDTFARRHSKFDSVLSFCLGILRRLQSSSFFSGLSHRTSSSAISDHPLTSLLLDSGTTTSGIDVDVANDWI